MALLPWMAKVWLCDPRRLHAILDDCMRIQGLRSKICGSEVSVFDPGIIAQKLGPEVCTAKSLDGPSSYFAHNKYVS